MQSPDVEVIKELTLAICFSEYVASLQGKLQQNSLQAMNQRILH